MIDPMPTDVDDVDAITDVTAYEDALDLEAGDATADEALGDWTDNTDPEERNA